MSNWKRWPHPKSGSRVRPSKLERNSTVNSLSKECIMFGGDCKCFVFEECKYLKELVKNDIKVN